MTEEGKIINLETGEELTTEEQNQMRATVAKQIAEPAYERKDMHIKKSNIWQCSQLIRKIQRQLVAGYSFDKAALTMMVNDMFGFINGIASPEAQPATEVKVEEIQ